jgi:predicted transcriptional regulator
MVERQHPSTADLQTLIREPSATLSSLHHRPPEADELHQQATRLKFANHWPGKIVSFNTNTKSGNFLSTRRTPSDYRTKWGLPGTIHGPSDI